MQDKGCVLGFLILKSVLHNALIHMKCGEFRCKGKIILETFDITHEFVLLQEGAADRKQ